MTKHEEIFTLQRVTRDDDKIVRKMVATVNWISNSSKATVRKKRTG